MFMIEFLGQKNLLTTQHKMAKVLTCFLKHVLSALFEDSECSAPAYSTLSLGLGHSHSWCDLCGVLEHALSEFCVS